MRLWSIAWKEVFARVHASRTNASERSHVPTCKDKVTKWKQVPRKFGHLTLQCWVSDAPKRRHNSKKVHRAVRNIIYFPSDWINQYYLQIEKHHPQQGPCPEEVRYEVGCSLRLQQTRRYKGNNTGQQLSLAKLSKKSTTQDTSRELNKHQVRGEGGKRRQIQTKRKKGKKGETRNRPAVRKDSSNIKRRSDRIRAARADKKRLKSKNTSK